MFLKNAQVFRKEDKAILHFLNDDGMDIEPSYYVPVIPMVLVNGACGIGTGFSTSIPCYNPLDVIAALRVMIDGKWGNLPHTPGDLSLIHI